MYESLKREAAEAFEELCESGNLKRGNLIVIGGSSSEIRGGHIGKDSSYEVGTAVVSTLIEKADEKGLHLAFQCCEHLNRALIIERKIADELGYEEVTVVPWLHAGELQPTIRTETGFKRLACRHRLATRCTSHCSTCVAQVIRGMMI